MLKIGIVVGEPSGDYLGAELVRRLREKNLALKLYGIGGPELQEEGCQSLYPMEKLSLIGIIEVAKHFFELLDIRRKLKQYFMANPPDIFIGIDSPDFNLPLERYLRRHRIKTIHYVSPSVWAWREGRLKTIAESVDLMLTLFPFEKKYYDAKSIPALCTGHPLARQIPEYSDQTKAQEKLGLRGNKKTYVAVLPGSRYDEIKRIAPAFLEACKILHRQESKFFFIASFLDQISEQLFVQIKEDICASLPIVTFVNQTRSAMVAADVILVASGTATLEAMLVKRPMVVGYKVNPITALLIRWMLKSPFVSLPNLLLGEAVVPELLQEKCDGRHLSDSVLHWLENESDLRELIERFHVLHTQLLRSNDSSIANAILELSGR